MLALIFNKIPLNVEDPAPVPVRPPHLVTNWQYFDPKSNTMVPMDLLHLEQSDEKEYKKMFPELYQQTQKGMSIAILKINNLSSIADDSKGNSLPGKRIQPGDLDSGKYIQ